MMLKKILTGCGVGLFSMLTAMPVSAQAVATLVLRDGQRPSGELIDLNASGFTLKVNGQNQQFPANNVASLEFVVAAPPAEAQARIDAGQPLVVLRNGQIVEGRLSDIGGTRPLRLTVDTASGKREFTSNDVAQIHLNAMNASARAAVPAGAIVVQANQPWTSTGIMVSRGERVAFSGTGDIMIAANASSGVGGSSAVTNPRSRYPAARSPVGALIARIGNGTPFEIGINTNPIMMAANGELFIGPNDDNFDDNTGSYTVTVTRLGR